MAQWRSTARELLDTVGWNDSKIVMRAFVGGATLQISAPTDALYAATELVKSSWTATTTKMAGVPFETDAIVRALREQIAEELSPTEVALAQSASEHGVT